MRLILTTDLAIPVVERLVLLQEDLDEPFHHLNVHAEWTSADRIRLAVHVWPEAPDEALLRFREALRAIASATPPASFETVGASFAPDESAARYIVAGTRAGADGLRALHRRVQAASEELGGRASRVPWEPYVSVARLKTPGAPPLLEGVLRPYSETPFGETRADELVLYRAELSRGAESLRQIERFALRGR